MDTSTLKPVIEAALLASTQPLSMPQLENLFAGQADHPVSHEQIATTLEALRDDCAERGIELVEVASGFRFQVRRDMHAWVAKLWTERPSRYSRALLETLALIAYRQPITRGEIEQVRGVGVSSHIVKTLEEREWIRVVGHRDAPGRPALFGTTRLFLDYFNLKSLDELPPLADILNLEDMDPQLALGEDRTGGARVGPPEATATASDAARTDDGDDANEPSGDIANTDAEADAVADPESAGIADDQPADETAHAEHADDAHANGESGDTTIDTDARPSAATVADADTASSGHEDPEENRA